MNPESLIVSEIFSIKVADTQTHTRRLNKGRLKLAAGEPITVRKCQETPDVCAMLVEYLPVTDSVFVHDRSETRVFGLFLLNQGASVDDQDVLMKQLMMAVVYRIAGSTYAAPSHHGRNNIHLLYRPRRKKLV